MGKLPSASHEASFDDFADIEAMIRDAGEYVNPSEDLRPATIERAKAIYTRMRRRERCLLGIAGILFIVASCFPLANGAAQWRQSVFAPSAEEMERQAMQTSADSPAGPNWAFYEAFLKLRQQQSEKLGITQP